MVLLPASIMVIRFYGLKLCHCCCWLKLLQAYKHQPLFGTYGALAHKEATLACQPNRFTYILQPLPNLFWSTMTVTQTKQVVIKFCWPTDNMWQRSSSDRQVTNTKLHQGVEQDPNSWRVLTSKAVMWQLESQGLPHLHQWRRTRWRRRWWLERVPRIASRITQPTAALISACRSWKANS